LVATSFQCRLAARRDVGNHSLERTAADRVVGAGPSIQAHGKRIRLGVQGKGAVGADSDVEEADPLGLVDNMAEPPPTVLPSEGLAPLNVRVPGAHRVQGAKGAKHLLQGNVACPLVLSPAVGAVEVAYIGQRNAAHNGKRSAAGQAPGKAKEVPGFPAGRAANTSHHSPTSRGQASWRQRPQRRLM
jgi:hypothetical protein